MQPDDVMPNDGTYFVPREPESQINDRKREKAQVLQGLTVLKEVIARLEERIEFYQSVDAMPSEAKADPVKFMNLHNANQLTRDNLRAEKEYIEQLIESTTK